METAVRGELPSDPRLRALCGLAVKMTRQPASIREEDIEDVRAQGLDDAAIHDAIQVIAYFNYINRVADAVGVGDEPDW